MGPIRSGLFISLDGGIEAPGTWHFPYFNDDDSGDPRLGGGACLP